ncbi:cytochrome c oxidase subunit CcoM [Pseudomonas lopnurensis]|nr:cytochrome c oxidase subunit CcoM [Pseudomonas lopnurensis]
MFVDNVVLAGVVTVGLMVAFFVGFGYFVWRDAHKKKG